MLVDRPTLCALVYVPGVIEKVGVATVPVITNVDEATAESTQSVLVAQAFTVCVVSSGMVNDPVYTVDEDVGVLPSVV